MAMGKVFYNVLAAAMLSAATLMSMPVSGAEALSGKSRERDSEGHELVRLWKEFRLAEEDDRPDLEAEMLGRIISQAERRHLPWDFYDGWRHYEDISLSKDWKRRAELDSAMSVAVAGFDEPVVTYMMESERLSARDRTSWEAGFLERNAGRLKAARNPQFYRTGYNTVWSSYGSALPETIIDNISDDYEYVLWSVLLRGRGKDAYAVERLSEYLGDAYPNGAYLEYYMASAESGRDRRKTALEEFAMKYSGRAVSCYAVRDLLSDKFLGLLADSGTSSDDYRVFRDECEEFEKIRSRFSGMEKHVAGDCREIEDIIKTLDTKCIRIESSEDSVYVLLRNSDGCRIELVRGEGGETLFSDNLENSEGSYFLYDTLRVDLPALDDGTYRIRAVSGKEKTEVAYRRYTVSAACRVTGEGLSVYAACMKSGRPLGCADVDVFRGDSLVASFRSIDFSNGFVPLGIRPGTDPENSHGYYMVCSCRDGGGRLRSTGEIPVDIRMYAVPEPLQDKVSASIFKDRAAFSTGDTLRFKAVLFSVPGTGGGYRTLPEGESVKAVLTGPRGEKVDSASFHTNSFGSVAGAFHLQGEGMNGRYNISVWCRGKQAASSSFIVGDIEIPTYDLEFDSSDTLYFPGNTVTVGGTVSSYTGHSLSAASVGWKVSKWGETVDEGTVKLDGDGHFSFSFADKPDWGQGMPYSYYNIEVRVSDATGETLEFSKGVTVAPRFDLSAELVNPSEGIVTPLPQRWEYRPMSGYGTAIMDGDTAKVRFVVRNADYREIACVPVRYSVYSGETLVTEGNARPGDIVDVDLSGMASGLYRIEAEASAGMELPEGKDSILVGRYIYELIKISGRDTALDADVENLFRVVDDEKDIVLQMATGNGPLWAVVEIWGSDALAPLRTEMVYLEGKKGKPGSAVTLRYGYEDTYPDDVRVYVMYFRNGRDYSYSVDCHRKTDDMCIPLEFISFTDSTGTGTEVTVTMRTGPGAECAVSVFDKGTEQIMPNVWNRVFRASGLPYVPVHTYNGHVGCMQVYVKGAGNSYMGKAAPVFRDMVLEESSVDASVPVSGPIADAAMQVRSDFSNTIAFLPFLVPGDDGTVFFTFRTSDKISTYRVNAVAHDRKMREGLASREILVTKPVMVSVSGPKFLHEGDRYVMSATVSSSSGKPVSGMLDLYVYGSGDCTEDAPDRVVSRPVTVFPGGTSTEYFVTDVPEGKDELGFKLVFETVPETGHAEDACWSDGIFFTVPVEPGAQVLTESHSAVLRPGTDADSLKSVLSGMFVNTFPYGAVTRTVPLLDLIKSSIPVKSVVSGDDVVSISDALYVRMLSGCISGMKEVDTLVEDILECQNADGGFGWFPGMKSSGQVTALLLERVAELRGRTHVKVIGDVSAGKALAYLDSLMLSCRKDSAFACVSGISLAQYLYVRTMYPSVPLHHGTAGAADRKALSSLKRDTRKYLYLRSGAEAFDGRLLDKARRASVSLALLDGEGAFGKSLGLGVTRKMARVMASDIASLVSYAVEYRDGGMYFPNAVMPFAGLLDSELYAHSLICDLLQDWSCRAGCGRIPPDRELAEKAVAAADGTRLWMMLQKETQQWDGDPAYVRAMASVLDGSARILDTEIMIMSKRYEKPFGMIKAAGNGLAVTRRFFRETSGVEEGTYARAYALEEIHEGDTLSVGDKIVCRCTVWSRDNRSFVRLSVPHDASVRPVDQVSGMGGLLRVVAGHIPATAYFRNVLSDKTEYYFDILPEETTVIEEEFFVTRPGSYLSPVAEAECVYAPHYRANDAFLPPVPVDVR